MSSKWQVERLAAAILVIALLALPARALTTENMDVIWSIPGDSLAGFGCALASGDVNGDGIPDILVATDTFRPDSIQLPLRGMVYVFYGNHVGETIPDVVLRSPVWKGANTPFIACGDLNADGYADVAMGEDAADDGLGLCTVFLGGNPMDTIPDVLIHGRGVWWLNGYFGSDISIGDVNGDGHDDLVVGAYYTAPSPGHFGRGRVYVFYGGPGFDTIPDVMLQGGHDGYSEGFGVSVTAQGDFDHDGFHDLYIGAWQYGGGLAAPGRMYMYYGGNPMDTSYDMAMSGEGAAHFLGFERPGALNAQGSFDYAVEGNELWPRGAWNPGANCGKVYVHQGGRPMDSIPDVELFGRLDTANLGYSAQSAGDVTGDGNDDLLAGAPYLPPSGSGAAYLWETGNHFDTVPDAWMMGEVHRRVGMRVCTAGDLDGDGRDEFIISSYTDIPPARVWVCKYTGSGVDETPSAERRAPNCGPTVVGGVLMLGAVSSRQNAVYMAELLDVGGRKVMGLMPGANDVRALAPGVYFVRSGPSAVSRQPSAVTKVVIAR